MINIEKLILFKAETSKSDLINNTEDKIIATLDDMALSATINYNLDSNHTINIELDSSLAEEVINTIGFKQIIKAKTLEDEYEYFVLTGVDKILDDRIQIIGVHWVTEITSKIFCDDLKPRGLNANLILKHIVEGSEEYKNNIQYAKDIETSGNIDTLVNCNLWQTSLGDYLEDLQELYGNCEVRKRGFRLSLMDYVGSRIPRYTVNYAENLISNTTSEEYILVKGILPKGYDRIRGNIVYSDKISSGITKAIEYPVRLRVEGEESEEGYTYYDTLEECQRALEDLAKKEFELNKIDEIVITYDIKFLDLATTLEGDGEKAYLSVGDVVNTRIDKYNININTRIIELNYNILAEEIEDIVLSNADVGSLKVPTLNSVSKEVENKPDVNEVISITKLESTNILNAGMKNSYVVVRKNEILVMDSPEVDNAVNVWRWNKNGLMHSNSGYNGTYTMGLRYDGVIFADLIRAGVLKSLNGESWINLDTGEAQLTGELRSKFGDQWVGLNSGGLTFQDYHKKEQMLRVGIAHYTDNRDMNGVEFAMPQYADFLRFSHIGKPNLNDGWTNKDTFYNFFELWSGEQTVNGAVKKKGITINAPMYVNDRIKLNYPGSSLFSNDILSASWNNIKGLLGLYGDNGSILGYQEGNDLYARIVVTEESHQGTGDNIKSWGNWNCSGSTVHNATFSGRFVNSYANTLTKTLVETHCVEAENKQVRINFTDVQLKDGKAILNIPNKYLHINRGYIVSSLVKKGRGDVWVSKEFENRFIIEGTEDIKINIEVIINLEDESLYTSTAKTTDDQQLCIDMSTGQPIGV